MLSYTSFTFGLIFWGNLIDNAVNPKAILIICESFIAVSYLSLGMLILSVDYKQKLNN